MTMRERFLEKFGFVVNEGIDGQPRLPAGAGIGIILDFAASEVRLALQPREQASLSQDHRERLGMEVRAAWVTWAVCQPNPKPSWLEPWDKLSEADKEADRQIGEALYRSITATAGQGW